MIPRILAIAGSDSGGGAGIQADIRAITALGGHAMTAVTAVTAQNTLGVQRVLRVPPEMVLAQIDAVASDIGIDAIKIGMIGDAAIAHAVADWLRVHSGPPVVFDPVMVATSGAALADGETVDAFARLMRAARLVTPNLPEMRALAGLDEGCDDVALLDAATVLARDCGADVVLKGGHGAGDAIVDRLVGAGGLHAAWRDRWIRTRDTHGTGCILSSAIATGLGAGLPAIVAIDRARMFVRAALLAAPGIGGGHGPMGDPRAGFDCVILNKSESNKS